ncbi:MAG: putative essential recombination function protein [Prokaryotic dsDNA virus sp.]|nr:MAG: putative essential recombination function protein [Prokaryotic dsDNA virus sp.]|tara:strand:+ start:3875 stop:4570 length:696 start_codon:yes stop_codon:yes gene_type:complete
MEQNLENRQWEGIIPHLLKAQVDVEAVEKASRNDFGGYKYASAEDMITASRAVLHKHGLIVTRNGWRILNEGNATPVVEAVYVLAHKDGHSVVCATQYPICVGKGRPEDKALNASLTTGLSYFLRDLLLIPRCDVEVDQRPDTISRPSVRDTKKPASSRGNNNKHKFMSAVACWVGRDVTEPEVAERCIQILQKHALPVDGTATAEQFKEVLKFVEEQIEQNVDWHDILDS